MVTAAVMDAMRNVSGAATGSLVAAVWQGALLAGAAALGLKMLPRTPAAVRFAIWFAVFLVTAALPFAGVWTHGAGNATAIRADQPWLTVSERWSESLLALWVAVSAVRAGMLALSGFRLRALWKRATPIHFPASSVVDSDQSNAFGRRIQICTSDEVDRPSVIGFFSPKVLIPAWLVQKLTPTEMSQVILHEAGHLRRSDDWLNLIQKIALVAFPLNPVLAWVERRLCFERELACDERVLKVTGAPKAYASCLTSLAEHRMTNRRMALLMGAVGRESELGQRVRRILARGEEMTPARARVVMGGAVCALLLAAAGLERCPQVIGFSSGPGVLAAAAQSATGVSGRRVLYRPVAPRDTGNFRAINTSLRAAPRVAAEGAARRHGSRAADRASAAGNSAVGQWVVMTSWTAEAPEYGGRVVMTSIETGLGVQPSPNAMTPAGARNGAAVARKTSATPAVQAVPVEEISPYAAVPVRGGWLVFQL